MRLTRLEAHGFAMHADLDLDLSGVPSLAIVGENGAGKSRLLDAVMYSLYGQPARGRIDQMVQHGESGTWVRTTWDQFGQEVIVHRTRTLTPRAESSLELWIDGERKTRHTIAETQEAIRRLIGLDADVILAGPVMAQGESDALMRAEPRDRKEMLARLFGLGEYDAYHEEASSRLAEHTVRIRAFEADLARLGDRIAAGQEAGVELAAANAAAELVAAKQAVAGTRDKVASLREEAVVLRTKQERQETLAAEIVTAQRQADDAIARRLDAERRHDEARALIAAPPTEPELMVLPDPVPEERLTAAKDDAATFGSLTSERQRMVAELTRHEEIDCKDLCDVCPFAPDAGAIELLRTQIADVDHELTRLFDAPAKWNRLSDEAVSISRRAALATQENAHRQEMYVLAQSAYEQAQQMVDNLSSMIADAKRSEEEANATIRERNAENMRLLQEVERSHEVATALQAATVALTAATTRQDRAEAAFRDADAAHQLWLRAGAEFEIVEVKAKQAEQDAAVLRVVERLFHRDGVPLMVLERGLPLVEARSNEILGRLPGGLRMTLLTQVMTRGGQMRDALEIVVDQDGDEMPYDVLSGAERFRIDFALRLGVADVLAQQGSGLGFATLWLDEPFSAQSPRALETVLECLSAVAADFGLMVVTTHQPDVADRFPARLIVTKEDGVATVELAA